MEWVMFSWCLTFTLLRGLQWKWGSYLGRAFNKLLNYLLNEAPSSFHLNHVQPCRTTHRNHKPLDIKTSRLSMKSFNSTSVWINISSNISLKHGSNKWSRFTLKIKRRWWTWAVYSKQLCFVCELFEASLMNMEIMKKQACRASLTRQI